MNSTSNERTHKKISSYFGDPSFPAYNPRINYGGLMFLGGDCSLGDNLGIILESITSDLKHRLGGTYKDFKPYYLWILSYAAKKELLFRESKPILLTFFSQGFHLKNMDLVREASKYLSNDPIILGEIYQRAITEIHRLKSRGENTIKMCQILKYFLEKATGREDFPKVRKDEKLQEEDLKVWSGYSEIFAQ